MNTDCRRSCGGPPLLGGLGLALALAWVSPPAGSGPARINATAATANAVVLEPVRINDVVGSLFSVAELLAPLQGAAGTATGSVLIRLVNVAPALVSASGEAATGSPLSLLLSRPAGEAAGMVALLNTLLTPLTGGTLQRELVADVSLKPDQPPGREGDERVAIVVAFN